MKIIEMISVFSFILISILTILTAVIKNEKIKECVSTTIPILYMGIWLIFIVAYYFHDWDKRWSLSSLDLGGYVLLGGIIGTISLWNSIFKRKKYIIFRILGLLPLFIICCIFLYLAPLNAELEGEPLTFNSILWYIYYLLGTPIVASSWDDFFVKEENTDIGGNENE